MLDRAWEEVKNEKEKREMFWSLVFSIGDITARRHNLFRGNKIDNGGNASRYNFHLVIGWMKRKHFNQFLKFMWARLFNEFISFDVLLANRVRTVKKSTKVEKVINNLGYSATEQKEVAKYIASVIQGDNMFDKLLVAKHLTRPRLSKRKGHKKMLAETKNIMLNRQAFLKMVSDFAGLQYIDKGNYIDFVGYYQWRKQLNQNMESVLFSTKEILKMDEQQFIAWISQLPASARFRVRSRLLTKDNKPKTKWGDQMPQWYLKWENYKEEKQKEQRVLEEKISEGVATEEEVVKLKEVKKEAKVSTGAVNFKDMFIEILTGKADKVKIQPFLDKIKLDYNTLVFIDDSGSMQSTWHKTGFGFTPFDFACFMATICMMKNPDSMARNLIGLFSNKARMFSNITALKKSPNSLIHGTATQVTLPLFEPKLHFLDNLQNIRNFANAMKTGNGTNISSIPDDLHKWTNGDALLIEQLMQYPVWTIITDGNWNNMYSPEASMNDFMRKCENYFGFRPFIIAIDVAAENAATTSRFAGIDNFMFLSPNPAQIEQFLTNFKDMDIMDVYTPLESLFRSNRYAFVRNSVL